MQGKVVVIGLDAADANLTRRLMGEGRMPRLASVRDEGHLSSLKSTIPPQTAPAWTSMTTGVNPGKHGIYYFYNFSTTPISIVNASHTSTPRIWDYVGALGQRSVVVNVPVTYPAQEMVGSMISGIPPWYFDSRSVYPSKLFEDLRARDYTIETPMSRGLESRPDELVDRLVATEEKRVDLFIDLLKRDEWSFAMVVITALDRVQHKIVGKGEAADSALARCYGEIDRLAGNVIDSIGKDVNYLITSDHGFNERPLAFYPNSWLYSQGLLRRKSSLRYRLTRFAHDIFDGHLLWLPQSITKRFQGAATSINSIDAVDLGSSRAFVPGTDGVLITRSEQDRKRILSGLSELKDESGVRICQAYPREEVYSGDKLSSAPDVLIVPRDDVNICTDPFSPTVLSRSGGSSKGNHSSEGILIAAGPGIKKSGEFEASVEDVAPTCLVLLGIRPSSNMDGRPLQEMLVEPETKSLTSAEVVGESRAYAFSEKEEKQVMENLRRLGYA